MRAPLRRWSDIVVGGVTIDIGTGYQHWVNIGGAVFSYVQEANSGGSRRCGCS